MSDTPTTLMTSFSIPSATGASQGVFPLERQAGFVERWVSNPNATGSIWINPFGGVAVANGLDCVEVIPGALIRLGSTNPVTAITTATNKINAGQR